MKKLLFIILGMCIFICNVNATSYVTSFYTVTNKCSVLKENKAVIPVTIRVDNEHLKLSTLMEEIKIDYITNYEDVLKLNIYGINNDKIDVYIDFKRNSVSKSLVYFDLLEDIELSRHDELVSFNIGVEILNNTKINKMDVFGNEVILADESTCEILNGYKVTEIERIVDLSKTDHKEYINDLIDKCIISILTISLVICSYMLIRKKK